jgi:RimJ/RimL family protein N-acetyltransferase
VPDLVEPVVPAGRLRAVVQPTLRAAGGLTLRPWLAADAGAVRLAFADPAIQRWHARRIDSTDEALAWVAQWHDRWRDETDACWAVTGTGGAVLGRVALRNIDLSGGHADCAYWVLPAARGGGVAPRAVEAVAGWAFREVGLHRLEVVHAVANTASCRVATKAGFALEGTMRSSMLHDDGWHDMHLHGRVAGDPVGETRSTAPVQGR